MADVAVETREDHELLEALEEISKDRRSGTASSVKQGAVIRPICVYMDWTDYVFSLILNLCEIQIERSRRSARIGE